LSHSSAAAQHQIATKVQGSERRDVMEEEELCIPNDARK